ncbi:MAG: hypothetical protein R2761_06665 [Acidimicrobiales bacterium]
MVTSSNYARDAWLTEPPIHDVVVDEGRRRRSAARTLTLAGRIAWAWWPLWLPAIPFLGLGPILFVARLAGHHPSAALAMLVLPVPLGLVLSALLVMVELLTVERARTAVLAAPGRCVQAGLRARWPRLCSLAGVSLRADGAERHPRLVSVTLTGHWWHPSALTVVCEPLAQQDVDCWDVITSRLTRQLGYSMGTPRVVSSRVLELRMRRRELPDEVVIGRDVPFARIAVDASHIDLGDSALGDTMRWALDDPTRPHLVVAGGTGGGKGNAARLIMGGAWLRIRAGDPVELIVANPKRAGEFNWANEWAAVASTTGGITAAIRYVYEQMSARGDLLLGWDADNWLELSDEQRRQFGGRLLFIFDEWSDFITDPYLPDAKAVMGMMVSIARKGRALGINLVITGQHISGEMFSPGSSAGTGTALIANLNARIGIGSLEPSGARTMFGDETLAKVANGDIPGRAYTKGLGTRQGNQPATPGQIWFMPKPLVAGLGLPSERCYPPKPFDLMAAVAAEDGQADVIDVKEARRRRK